jgi:hypothetical protein
MTQYTATVLQMTCRDSFVSASLPAVGAREVWLSEFPDRKNGKKPGIFDIIPGHGLESAHSN